MNRLAQETDSAVGAGAPTGAQSPPDQPRESADAPLSRDEVSRRATTGAVTVMARGLAVRGVGMLGNIVLARLLLPRDFGMIALGTSIVMFGDFLASGGLGAALVRQPGPLDRRDLEAVFGFQLVITIAISAVATAVAAPLSEPGALAAIMMWSLVIDSARAPTALPLERQMAYRIVLQAEVIENVVWNVAAVAAVVAGLGVWGVALAQPVRAVAGYLALTLRGPVGFVRPRLQWSRTRRLLRFGLQFQAANAVQLIRDQGLNIAIAAIGGFVALGVWSIVYRMTTVVIILMESLWRVSFPAMSRLRETGAEAGPVVERAIGVASALTGFLVVPLAGSAPALIPVLFGPRWNAAIHVMPLSATAIMLAGPLGAVAIGFLLSEGRAGIVLWMTVLDGLATWIVALPLLALVGVIGVGWGQLACGLTDLTVLTVALWRGPAINALAPSLALMIAVGTGAVTAWLVCSWLGTNFGALLASIAAGESVYAATMLTVRRAAAIDALRVGLRTVRQLAHVT